MRNYRAGSVMTDRKTILTGRRIKNAELKKKKSPTAQLQHWEKREEKPAER